MRVDNYRRVGLHYLNEARDWYALRGYRREGLWTFWRWLGQIFLLLLRGRLIFQLADPRDPAPRTRCVMQGPAGQGKATDCSTDARLTVWAELRQLPA